MDEGQDVYKTSVLKNVSKGTFKLLFWIIVAAIILVATLIFCTQAFLESNERKILDDLPFMSDSSISVGATHISLFKNFPLATVSINDIRVENTTPQDSAILISGLNADFKFNLKDWRTKSFRINEIQLSDGSIKLSKPTDGSGILDKLLSQLENKEAINKKSKKNIEVSTDNLKLELKNIDLIYTDLVKTSTLSGTINHLQTSEIKTDSAITIRQLDVKINELTFKKSEGTYLKNALVEGQDIQVNNSPNGLKFLPTVLKINEHIFNAEVFLSRTSDPTYIHLENKKTHLKTILPLLPQNLSTQIKPYKISGTFPTKAQLIFKKNKPALINIHFSLNGNDAKINKLKLSSTYSKGYFTNRHNNRNGITLILKDFRSKRETFLLESDKVVVTSNPIQKATIKSDMIIKGSAEELNAHFDSDNFILEDGAFQLEGRIDGSLSDLGNLLEKSDINLGITDLNINYIPAQSLIPIKGITLTKKANQTNFTISSTTLKSGYPYHLEGQLFNLTSLISDYTETTTTSEVLLKADRFGWEDFVSIFSKPSHDFKANVKSDGASKQSMKSTLKGINKKFKPTIRIQIDTFEYYNLINLHDVATSAFFDEHDNLILDKTKFKLDQGYVTAQAKLDLKQPNKTGFTIALNGTNLDLSTIMPTFDYFNVKLLTDLERLPDDFNLNIAMTGEIDDITGLLTNSLNGEVHFESNNLENINGDIKFNSTNGYLTSDLNLSGSPKLFNDLFKNDQFIFQEAGQFSTSIKHSGDIISLEELIQHSTTHLSIINGAVLYKDVDVIFPLNNLELDIKRDTAHIKLHLYSEVLDREIDINGDINNLSELVFGYTGKTLTTKVSAISPIINLSHAIDIFENPSDTTDNIKSSVPIDQKMKTLIGSLFKRFQPDLHIELDTFIITDKLHLTNLTTGCELVNLTHFRLESTNFDINGGNVKLNMEVDISKENEEPFNTQVTTTNLDLASTLEALRFLGSESLRDAERLEGTLELKVDFAGSLQDLKLITAKNQGVIDFELHDLKLKGIDLLDRISRKIFSPGLFSDLSFAPLINVLQIDGAKLDIPQMEVQTDVIDFFMEGHLDDNNNTNIWLSVPLDNIKRKNKASLKSRNYEDTKRKFYIEIKPDKKGKIGSKFRFRKKKFYKQRGLDWKKYK